MKLALCHGCCVVLLAAITTWGAENVSEYNARVWQSDEGMPMDAAWTGTQTPDGFLWVGTRGGFARFDGEQFKIFDSHNVPGLSNPNIVGLRSAKDGSLWVATATVGVYRFKDGKFEHFTRDNGLPSMDCVGSIFEHADGSIWIGTFRGLARFQGDHFERVYNGVVRRICEDLSSNIWLSTTNGIDCWSNGSFILHLGKTNGLTSGDGRALSCDSHGVMWVGDGADVGWIDHDHIKKYTSGDGPDYEMVTVLHRDRRGVLWAGTYGGLNRIVNGKFVPELNSEGLPYGTVMDIFEDREGNMWVCAKDGLIRLKPNRVLCYTRRQGLENDNISSVLEDRSGAICVGTWGGGLNRLKDEIVTAYTNTVPYPTLALGVGEDHHGNFWVGTDFDNGLFEIGPDSIRHFTSYRGHPIPAVRAIFEDSNQNLWVGTSGGLFRVRDGKVEQPRVGPGPVHDVIRALCEDSEKNLWMGTHAGVLRYHDGELTRFTTTNGLKDNAILDLYESKEKVLWIGTRSGGLSCYRDGKLTTYTTKNGLISDSITAVLEDDNGWLWLGSDRGIFRISLKNLDEFDHHTVASLRCIDYGKSDGMVNRICNAVAKPSAWKSRDGRLWFATIKGVCVIDPNKNILPDAPPPPVVIEQVRTDQEAISVSAGSSNIIRVPPGRSQLEFQYAALSFRAPEENQFKYKLEGADSDWVFADKRRIAHYNNLYPGKYNFHVLACNSDGVWNEIGAKLAVVLLPYFWQTWWFQPALLAAAACSLAVLYRVILQRRREIERLRLRIAADLHDEIGSNLASIALLSQLGEKPSSKSDHSELSEIHRIALMTVNSIREIVWFINPDYDTMPEMVVRMRDVAAQLLIGIEYRFDCPFEVGGGKLSPEFRRNLFLIFKEILHNIVKHAHATHVDIRLHETQGTLFLRVADNGRGFDPAATSRGNGLRNLRLRAGQLGGTVEISPGVAGGTIVNVSVKVT